MIWFSIELIRLSHNEINIKYEKWNTWEHWWWSRQRWDVKGWYDFFFLNDIMVCLKTNQTKYTMNRPSGMNNINDNIVNKIAEYNLLHYIPFSSKNAKHTNSNCYPILHRCMIKQKGTTRFKHFIILLDIGCRSTI